MSESQTQRLIRKYNAARSALSLVDSALIDLGQDLQVFMNPPPPKPVDLKDPKVPVKASIKTKKESPPTSPA